MSRLDALNVLLNEYHASVNDYDADSEEDLRPYFDGDAELAEWVCVTVNYSSHGSAKYFFLPRFDTAREAMLRAAEYAMDSLFEELPVAVVSLDTGETYEPDYGSIQWSKIKSSGRV